MTSPTDLPGIKKVVLFELVENKEQFLDDRKVSWEEIGSMKGSAMSELATMVSIFLPVAAFLTGMVFGMGHISKAITAPPLPDDDELDTTGDSKIIRRRIAMARLVAPLGSLRHFWGWVVISTGIVEFIALMWLMGQLPQ